MADPAIAIFAGGCFWCMQPPFDAVEGVLASRAGYTGGHQDNPTYYEVCAGGTGHTEAVEITYDPDVVSYADLIEVYWRSCDPTDPGGQFGDRGSSYRPAIFFATDDERTAAEASKAALDASGVLTAPVAVGIEPRQTFWPAEDKHQDYYKTCSLHYQSYKEGSGRGPFLRQTWGDGESS